jgi:opacity protein-like surface antigen
MIRKFAAVAWGQKPKTFPKLKTSRRFKESPSFAKRQRFETGDVLTCGVMTRVLTTIGCLILLVATAAVAQQTSSQPASSQQTSSQQTSSQQTPAQQPSVQDPAQQTSGQQTQQPSSQESSNQEASPEETAKRPKPKNYKNWNFNVGGGANLTNGTTKTFVRSGGGVGAVGVARNTSQYFGIRADFQFDNLPLRQSALDLAQAPNASSHVYSFMLDPIINIPATKEWDGYVVFGPSFYHRSGKLADSTAFPGSACNAFFVWWGNCLNGSLPLDGNFLDAHQNEFGFNFGGGIAYRIQPKIELYVEFRYLHGTRDSVTTDLRPITVGVRF